LAVRYCTSGFSVAGVTIVAEADMISETNQKETEAAGLSFIFGMRIPQVPYLVAQWRREHPGEEVPTGRY
jgi:hypothetical protein